MGECPTLVDGEEFAFIDDLGIASDDENSSWVDGDSCLIGGERSVDDERVLGLDDESFVRQTPGIQPWTEPSNLCVNHQPAAEIFRFVRDTEN